MLLTKINKCLQTLSKDFKLFLNRMASNFLLEEVAECEINAPDGVVPCTPDLFEIREDDIKWFERHKLKYEYQIKANYCSALSTVPMKRK